MPTKTSERWIADGENVTKKLEELGYKADLQYANDKIPTSSSRSSRCSPRAPRR